MKFPLCLALILHCYGQTLAQQGPLWTDKPETEMPTAEGRKLFPLRYRTAGLNVSALHDLLWSAPIEEQIPPSQSAFILEIPTPDGKMDSFRLVQYTMMEAGLANRYPDIRTYRGIHLRNPFKTIRCDWTVKGFSAMITARDGRYFVEPYARGNQEDYIIFFKHDYPAPAEPFSCGTLPGDQPRSTEDQFRLSGDCTFRSYRLAVATTGEYSNYFGADNASEEAIVLSEVVIAVNRVNDPYERDVTVRFILIDNTTNVFYYNPNTDPYSGDACNQLNQNQTTINNIIGSSNYDVGHVFGVGTGGCAQLYVICVNTTKAKGATGLTPPDGDPFYIDYVAHELGHQFGANHTQNNNCNRYNLTAMEPGSASTIMGYAGICPPDVQNNSDDYFHGISIQEINNYISGGNGNNCDAPITWSNSAPIVSPGSDYTIPKSTPFTLTATASDPNGDPLTYCWEQWDPEIGTVMPPASTNDEGPMFRTFDPDPSPTRYFPRLVDLVNNISPVWEVLPSVTRDMEFRVNVRDFHNGMAGCTDEDNVVVHCTATSGPFVVTSPNTSSAQWTEGNIETVTWNVANTTSSPVSCASVDILLSYDGGFTYPATLASSVPNDGSQSITVPEGTTTMARVMVKGTNNIFFDISNENFEILTGLPTYSLIAMPSTQSICPPEVALYTITVISLNGYSEPVTLSEVGHPTGSIISFSVNPVIPGNSSIMSVSVPEGALPDDYTLTINGASMAGPKNTTTELVVVGEPLIPTLQAPADGATDIPLNIELEWQNSSGADYYIVEVATDVLFADILFDDTTSATSIAPGILIPQTVYYWRVRSGNLCGIGEWSAVRDFETANCLLRYSLDVPQVIPSNGSPTITSELTSLFGGTIIDVNVIDLEGTHTWLGDLRFTLTSPEGTEVIIIDQLCTSQDNFDINLDDQVPPGVPPCPYNDGNTYQPDQPLSAFNGENAAGIWVLTVDDFHNQDGGSLNRWGLEICISGSCALLVTNTADSGIGTLRHALDCAAAGDTITFAPALFGSTIHLVTPLVITSDVHILSAPGQNITIDASATSRAVQVTDLAQVSLSGLTFVAGSALTGCGIQNDGDLILQDVTINPGLLSDESLLLNYGTLSLEGDCHISQ